MTLAELDTNVLDQSIAWLSNDSIVFGRPDMGLFRIHAAGGGIDRLTTPKPEQGEIDHHFPHPLPGRNAILFSRHLKSEAFDIAVLDLDTGDTKVIVPDGFDARYLPTGHLAFARGQSLMAAPFDLDRLELSGPPVVVVERVMSDNSVGGSGPGVINWGARYAVADDGTLAYIPPVPRTKRRLAWVGATGTLDRLPLEPRGFSRPSLSPDGARIAVQLEEDGRRDIWIYDLRQGTFTPLTSDGASLAPCWTPDGQRVTFSTWKAGREEVYWRRIDGSPAEPLVREGLRAVPRFIVS